MGRFINADSYASTGQGILGNNMFAYCHNTPVNAIDLAGCVPSGFNGGYDQAGFFNNFGEGTCGGGGGLPVVIGASVGLSTLGMAAWHYTVNFFSSLSYSFSQPLSYSLPVEDRAAKADAKIRSVVKKDSTVRYWSATVQKGYVDIGRPLTFTQAVHEVSAGRSVFAVTWYEAKAVALAAGGNSGSNNKALYPEIDSGREGVPGYYYHFHTYNRAGGHVYYLFGEA